MKRFLACLFFSVSFTVANSQIITPILPIVIGAAIMPEHGFLPGKKFQFYPTINKFDFGGKKLRIEFYDVRDSLQIKKPDCAKVEVTNESEFAGPNGANRQKCFCYKKNRIKSYTVSFYQGSN